MNTYSVEVQGKRGKVLAADSPKAALEKFLREEKIKAVIESGEKGARGVNARVCLLGGTRESISYYVLQDKGYIYAEVRSNYSDDNYVYIDAWKTADDNEAGKVVARISTKTGKVEYKTKAAEMDKLVQEEIETVLKIMRDNKASRKAGI
jgi:hypothetical protein